MSSPPAPIAGGTPVSRGAEPAWRGAALPVLIAAVYATVVLMSLGDERLAEEALVAGGTVLLFVSAYQVRTRPTGVVAGGALATCIVLAAAWRLESGHANGGVMVARLMADGLWLTLAFAVSAHVARRLSVLHREREALRRYRLRRRLGEGTFCDVFEAEHSMFGAPVALAIARRLPERVGARRVFSRAIAAAASLDHPAIVRVYEHGVTLEGQLFCVMELVDGVSLARAVELCGPMAPRRVIHLMRQTCSGLAYIHRCGLVHRDLKPENIFLLREGFDGVKLMDLGLLSPSSEGTRDAPAVSHGASEDHLGRVLGDLVEVGGEGEVTVRGTPLFLAPEAIMDPERIDARADVYALGAVAYYLLTGGAPLPGASVAQAIERQLFALPVRPSERRGAALPRDLEALVLECLAKCPERRPRDATALEARLAACEDADSWTLGEARAWWSEHAAALTPPRGAPIDDEFVVPRR